MNWDPIILTLKLATIVTIILFAISIPLSFWLAHTRSKVKPFIETLVSMPLVLPPTVLGFYLLVFFSPNGWLGGWLKSTFDAQIVFSFGGLVFASIIYSLPFMVHPIQSGLSNLPSSLKDASLTLGKSRFTTLIRVLLPNIKPSLLTGLVLTFAHTIGEFGVVLMIGGSIPGKTRVASIAIYDEVESLNYGLANVYSIVLFVLAFGILMLVYSVNNGYIKKFWK